MGCREVVGASIRGNGRCPADGAHAAYEQAEALGGAGCACLKPLTAAPAAKASLGLCASGSDPGCYNEEIESVAISLYIYQKVQRLQKSKTEEGAGTSAAINGGGIRLVQFGKSLPCFARNLSKCTPDHARRDNEDHRRCITACLVKATYVLEEEYQTEATMQILGPQPNNRYSRGEVFEYVPPDGASPHPSAPRYIVAFRGTVPLLHPNIFGDMWHLCSRFCEAHERIGELVNSIADADSTCSAVWLTANWFSVPEKAKLAVYLGGSFVKYTLAKTILRSQMKHMVTLFGKLSPWFPELYVHQRDWICSGFIDHFELQEQIQEWFPKIITSAAPLSYRHLKRLSAMFGSGIKRERLHLLPSARLWKNSSPDENAHELKQWWKPDLMLSPELYSGLECWPELC
ncbi:hypothetical protein PR202_gb21032 [Eleusine coracana subsp. coracana]|uniref:Uncharacterized protein n=1 Tax=Eleusine coracana subsp. coracana TaxID=191504 RepID=A0AAV5FA58_ELECO|nr:hypothetical protein PR202_gb21032 [Eleusine coracana subsp. coracana]